jgi:hypothetical protein
MSEDRLKEPVIILGPPRSGTTILGSLLSQHSSFGYFEEPRAVWRWGNEKHSDWMAPQCATPEVKGYIRDYFGDRLEEQGKARLLEKTPQNCLRPEFVDSIFPDAKYIIVHRDPIETIRSIEAFWSENTHGVQSIGGKKIWRKIRETSFRQLAPYAVEFAKRIMPKKADRPNVMWGPRLPGLSEMTRDMSLSEVAAFQWRFCMERIAVFSEQLGPSRVQVWRLEEMNENSFEEILNFLEIDMEDTLKDAVSQRSGVRRERSLDDAFMAKVRPIIEPTRMYLEQQGF